MCRTAVVSTGFSLVAMLLLSHAAADTSLTNDRATTATNTMLPSLLLLLLPKQQYVGVLQLACTLALSCRG
jgi:hypothetical protein